jgi:GNAT superfamily N-acetyltransferase
MELHAEHDPDPLDVEFLETQIRREASAATGLGDEVELAIFVRDGGTVVAGISGWTWGDCCELQSLWVEPSLRGRGLATRLIAAAEAEAATRGCTQTVHFTYDFQARALYERNGYDLVGRVEDFPSGTDVLWYHKRLNPSEARRDNPSHDYRPDPSPLIRALDDGLAVLQRLVVSLRGVLRSE